MVRYDERVVDRLRSMADDAREVSVGRLRTKSQDHHKQPHDLNRGTGYLLLPDVQPVLGNSKEVLRCSCNRTRTKRMP